MVKEYFEFKHSKLAQSYAKNHSSIIDEYYTDCNGHWAHTKHGWRFDLTECHTIRRDTVKQLIDEMRHVSPCSCEECLQFVERGRE